MNHKAAKAAGRRRAVGGADARFLAEASRANPAAAPAPLHRALGGPARATQLPAPGPAPQVVVGGEDAVAAHGRGRGRGRGGGGRRPERAARAPAVRQQRRHPLRGRGGRRGGGQGGAGAGAERGRRRRVAAAALRAPPGHGARGARRRAGPRQEGQGEGRAHPSQHVRGEEDGGAGHDGHRAHHLQRQPAALPLRVRQRVLLLPPQRGAHLHLAHAADRRGRDAHLQRPRRPQRGAQDGARQPPQQLRGGRRLPRHHHQRLPGGLQRQQQQGAGCAAWAA